MTDNIYFMSLGGFTKTDLSKSVAAFGNLLTKKSSFPYFAEERIYLSLAIDKVYYKTIDSYKLGEIDTSEFKARISDQLGIKNSPEIEAAWNTLCELPEEAKESISNFFQHQQTEQLKLCIVSATNPLQYNYVISEINKDLIRDNLLKITENPKIIIKTSFEEHNLALSELAKIAIAENNWDSSGYNIVSYDSRLTAENLMLENAEFRYDENQSWMSFTGDYPQDL